MSTIHGIIAASILGGLGSGPVDPGEDWNPVYEEALVNNDDWTNYCVRNVYAKGQFPATTKQVRVKVQARADAPMLIKGMTAGEREGATANFLAAPIRVTFNNSPILYLGSGESMYSDPINLPMSGANDLMVAFSTDYLGTYARTNTDNPALRSCYYRSNAYRDELTQAGNSYTARNYSVAIVSIEASDEDYVAPTFPAGHPLWRAVWLTGGHANYVAVAEMEMATVTNGPTLTYGGFPTAIGWYASNAPERAYDGSVDTYWESSSSALSAGNNHLGYIFMRNVEVNSLKVTVGAGETGERPLSGKVQWSDDGINWTDHFDFIFDAWTATPQTQEAHVYVEPSQPNPLPHTPGMLVTVAPGRTKSDLTNFPLYLDLNNMPSEFWAETNGTDLRAKNVDGSVSYPIDVIWIDPANEAGVAYVKVPTLFANDFTNLVLTWDGASPALAVTDPLGRNAVWSDYQWVNIPSEDFSDRTGKAVSAPTITGTHVFTKPLQHDGSGGGYADQASGKYVDQAVADVSTMGGIFTMAASFKFTDFRASGNSTIISYRRNASGASNRRATMLSDPISSRGKLSFGVWEDQATWDNGNRKMPNDIWHRGVAVFDTTNTRRTYLDGYESGTDTGVDTSTREFDTISLGHEDTSNSEVMKGVVGFSYLRPGTVSADWVEAEYLMLADRNFCQWEQVYPDQVMRYWRVAVTATAAYPNGISDGSYAGFSNLSFLSSKDGMDLTAFTREARAFGASFSSAEGPKNLINDTMSTAALTASGGVAEGGYDFGADYKTAVKAFLINIRSGYNNQNPLKYKLQGAAGRNGPWTDVISVDRTADPTMVWYYGWDDLHTTEAKPADPGKNNAHSYWRLRMYSYFDGSYWSVKNLRFSADGGTTFHSSSNTEGRVSNYSEGSFNAAITGGQNVGSHANQPTAIDAKFPAPVSVDSIQFTSRDAYGQAIRSFAVDYSDDGVNWYEKMKFENVPEWALNETRTYLDPAAVSPPKVAKVNKYVVAQQRKPLVSKISKYVIVKATS